MNDINQTRNDHIRKNINAMVDASMLVQIAEIDFKSNSSEWERQGWKEDQGLYDKLVMEYQNKTGYFLTRWVQ